MKQIFFALITITVLISSCTSTVDEKLISKHSIGFLTDSTQVRDLQSVFPNDSIARFLSGDEFAGNINNVEIYDKEGNKLLILTPRNSSDSTSTIQSVQIISDRFKTSKGLNSKSTFKTIKNNYKISRIHNMSKNIVITVNEINAFFNIDKNELPAELRFDNNLIIEAIQIPDDAKIKRFFIQWY